MTGCAKKLLFKTTPLMQYRGLASDWRLLEERCATSFFLSWSWVSCWLDSYSPEVDVLSVSSGGEVLGLALLSRSTFSKRGRFSSRRLHIQQTGAQELDHLWAEYNGVLCLPEYGDKILAQLMPYLMESYPAWDELVVGAVTHKTASILSDTSDFTRLNLWQSFSYGVDLKALASKRASYLSSLSRNARYQIRRSLKMYAAKGGLELQFASSTDEALSYFSDIAPLHIAKWGNGVGESGFANPFFTLFHVNLITNAFQLKQVDLIRIKSGNRTLGYLYNFLYNRRVYFYLSGLISEKDAKLKPGLCAHSLAIQHYLESGYDFYDFMGGDDRYKLSLGAVHEELFQIALQKKLYKFKIESLLRKVKQNVSTSYGKLFQR